MEQRLWIQRTMQVSKEPQLYPENHGTIQKVTFVSKEPRLYPKNQIVKKKHGLYKAPRYYPKNHE